MGTFSVCCLYQNYIQNSTAKYINFWTQSKTRVSVTDSSFGSKAKKWQFSPNFFTTFYQLLGRFSLTLQHIKNLEYCFSVSANYCKFSISSWSKIENFDSYHRTKIVHFWKSNNLCFMIWVKIFHFWPWWNWKLAIICRNGKRVVQIFYML